MDSRKQRSKLRLWLALIILILALAVLVLSALPETRIQQVVPMPPVILPSATPLSMFFSGRGI